MILPVNHPVHVDQITSVHIFKLTLLPAYKQLPPNAADGKTDRRRAGFVAQTYPKTKSMRWLIFVSPPWRDAQFNFWTTVSSLPVGQASLPDPHRSRGFQAGLI